jgi:hypothetical protein
MQQSNQQPRQNVHQATYRLLRQLAQQMEPVAKLAQETSLPGEPHPMDLVIRLLQQVVGGIEQVHSRLESLEARLDEPAVTKAIKNAVHG